MPGAARTARLSPWGRLVTGSAVLLVAALAALAIMRVAGDNERRVAFDVVGKAAGVRLDVADADVEIVGGGRRPSLTVTRTERYGFDHEPHVVRSARDGIVTLRARCPKALLHRCSTEYRLLVPDNVPLTVRTSTGTVRFTAYRGSAQVRTTSGAVNLRGVCGFSLAVRTGSGAIDADTACAPQQLTLRSTTGSIRARVPSGRYRVDVSTAYGPPVVLGLVRTADAPFEIDASSATGSVRLEGRR